jgi:5'-3' exonuclease
MICLIDGDILVYRVGFATQKNRFSEAQRQVDNWMEKIMEEFDTIHFHLYLSDSESNFRKEIDPNYKANRKVEKPRHYEAIINYMLDNWDAEVAWEQEADDAMGIKQRYSLDHQSENMNLRNTVICTVDKDLDQIAGKHYNFITGTTYETTYEEGLKFFYTQLLTGDPVDNIIGLEGIGLVKAAKILKGCTTEPELFNATYRAYNLVYKDKVDCNIAMINNGRLVKIRQYPNEMWEFPCELLNRKSLPACQSC